MKTTMEEMACPLCGSCAPNDYSVLYPAHLPSKALSTTTFSARRLPDNIHYQLVRCTNDQLVRSTPIFPHSVSDAFYRQSTVTYQDEIQNLITTYLHALNPVLTQLHKHADILEIGCGSGFMLSALKDKGYSKVHGIEPSVSAAQEANKNVRKQIIVKPFSRKAVNNKQFDLIYLFQTLDHLPNINQCMEDCYQSLKPGGYIVSLHHDVDYFLRRLLGESHPIIDIEHLQLFSQKTSAAIFEKHGFLIRAITSPANTISASHLLWLLPVPLVIKQTMLSVLKSVPFLNHSFRLKLGNVLVIAQKPEFDTNL